MNQDVLVMGSDVTVVPNMGERVRYRIRGIVRNAGTSIATACYVEAHWSPANLTGSSTQLCTAKSLLGGQAPARTSTFYVNPNSFRETGDLLWDVPDLSTLPPGSVASFKLVLKVFNTEDRLQQPNPSISPEQDPRCGVHCINIVGM